MSKLIKGKNDFATLCPELAKEWHPTKNGDLTPSDVTAGSGKTVWWLGKCGHEWCTVLYSRARLNSKCPYCANQKVLSGYNDLATTNSKLAEEWHPTKNGNLKATEIAEGSNKKVWWLGKCGHEWVATPNDRKGVQGTNCPYCSGQKLLVGFNDLQTACPKIAEEWHPTKNGNLKPTDVVSGSPKYVWWMCKEGHEWKAKISNRKALDSWCPYCSGHKILAGFNDLATLCPELLKEWDYERNTIQPTSIGKGSQENIWWKCSKGHSYQASPNNRTKGDGCPICSKEYRTSFPEQALFFYIHKVFPDTQNGNKTILDGMELDIYIPSLNTGIEYDGNNWHNDTRDLIKNDLCNAKGIRLIRVRESGLKSLPDSINIERKNNKSDADLERCILEVFNLLGVEVPDVSIKHDRMKITSDFITSDKEKSFAQVHPELVSEWNYEKNEKLTPEMVKAKSGRKVWWRCKKGHEWQATVNDRSNGHNCPYCSGHRASPGYNDLATTNPELAEEWHPIKNGSLKPTDVSVGSSKNVWWLGKCGHEWQAAVDDRGNGYNCPYCSGRKLLVGFNDFQTIYPVIAEEWHPTKNGSLKPTDIVSDKRIKVWWLGKCGHEWQANTADRTLKNSGCPYCSNKKVLLGFNDLATTNPILAEEWHPTKNGNLFPTQVTEGSSKKVWWLGKCGHEWQSIISDRNRGVGCPVCSHHLLVEGINDLATEYPRLAKEWDIEKNNISASSVVAGGQHKAWWKCKKGHEWQATISMRVSGQGCPFCAGKRVWIGFNDLATKRPEIAEEWHPTKNIDLLPTSVTEKSGKKVWWQCKKCGCEWEAKICSRSNGSGCPHCKNKAN